MSLPDLPRPLISVDALAARIGDPHLRLCDVRWKLGAPDDGLRAYAAGHLPGAIFVDLERDLSDPAGLGSPGRHPLPDAETFARRLARLGISDDAYVVAYDDAGGTVAARLWWMLDDLGHDAVAVLDGGIDAWKVAGLPLTSDIPGVEPGRLHLASRWSSTIDRDALRSRLGDLVVIDVRAPERYRGETEPVDPVAGHIPTALNLPTAVSLDGGLFRSPSDLGERYGRVVGDSAAVVSCGSGVNACHTALALRIAGLPRAILYAGSYSDWSRSGLPVEVGPDPGGSGRTD